MNWQNFIKVKSYKESDIHPHCPQERADIFQSFEGGSVELEVMDFLYSIIRLFKPQAILETGTHLGFSALAMAKACQDNGFGKIFSIELDPEKIEKAKLLVNSVELLPFVEFINGDSLSVIPQFKGKINGFGFVFLDSITPLRPKEFELLYSLGLISNIVAFHDTSRLREQTLLNEAEPQSPYCEAMDKIEKLYCRGGIENHFSRGFRVMQVR